jgi:NAD(P)-dependent dehydrogenase (short-subunit alcohol dehydrogenase family)
MEGLFDLSGKVAVVTGSTRGLGRAMAIGLAGAGAAVVINGRRQDVCDEVAATVAATTGRDAMAVACHVGNWDAVPAFVDAVLGRFGRIDVLVNNAGINPGTVRVTDMTLEYWRKVFSVNVEGPVRLSQLVAPVMREAGGGSIINIASGAGYNGGDPTMSAYGASKAALLNVSRNMAVEWAPWGVRVNVISPGPFRTEFTEGAERNIPGWLQAAAAATMLRRLGEDREIVGPTIYLASDASSFVTGEDHVVAGGAFRRLTH